MATTTAVGRSVTARPRAKRKSVRWNAEARTALLFLTPAFVGFVVFYAYPALRGFYLSFTNFDLLRNDGDWVGIDNYRALLGDALFWNALWITFKYVIINIGIQTTLALGIAVLMHRLTKSVVVRSIILIPWLIPNAVLALLWMWMLDPNLGIVNHWLNAIGIPSQGFLGSESQVIPTIAGINIWKNMGYTALLLFGGLVMIPKTYYEAAAIDGASEWRMFRTITIPLLRPVLALVLVVTVIGSFQVFDTIQIATAGIGGGNPGGPGNSSRVLYMYIFQQAFEFNALGYASALAVALIMLLVIVAAIQMRLLRGGVGSRMSATAELATTDRKSRVRVKRGIRWGRIAAWGAMVLLLFASLFPIFWMLRTALSTNSDLVVGSQALVPDTPTMLNLKQALGLASTEELTKAGTLTSADVNFFTALRNSVIVCTLITVGQVTFCAMAAYAFARLTFPGRNKLFFIFLTAMMIPPIFTLIPNFVLIKNLGWLNTFPGIVAPFFLMTPFAVFFLRQFFLGISKEVEEAALLDGAGRWKIFRQLILPMSAAPLATLAVLTYIMAWHEYMWPLVVGDSENVRVLTVALNAFKSSTPTTAPPWAPLMAATFLASVPLIVLFLAMAKKMVDAIGFSGIK